MIDKMKLCQKITELYPDIKGCGIDVEAFYSKTKDTWIVELKKDEHFLKHYLAEQDAKDCIDGRQCIALGLEIAQLRKNIDSEQF